MGLRDPTHIQSWQYTATCTGQRIRARHYINENLTGAARGDQKPARITFRTALWIIHGWNEHLRSTGIRFYLVVPNPPS